MTPRVEVRRRDPELSGVAADFSFGGKGLKGAMKRANRSGARYTLVAGERDLDEGVVQLKDMETGEQEAVSRTEIVTELEPDCGEAPCTAGSWRMASPRSFLAFCSSSAAPTTVTGVGAV